MSMRSAACLLCAAVALAAAADPPRERVSDANNLLRQGRTEDALQAYRNLQIDDPESELLYFNIGCAQLESADAPATVEDSVLAVEALNEAKASFDKSVMAEDPAIRRDARFNRVNCDSRLAKHLAATGDYEAAVQAFENAIYGYEDFLEQYPGHPGAQKNLNHMRYLLKKMLQNPPPEQEQQQQGDEQKEGDQEQDGDEQQQQENQGEQQGDQQNESEGEQSSENQDQNQTGEQGDQERQGDENRQQPGDEVTAEGQSSSDEAADDQQQAPGENQSDSNAMEVQEPIDLPDKQTIEAILEALQERDKEEQQNMRRVPQNPRRGGPWW